MTPSLRGQCWEWSGTKFGSGYGLLQQRGKSLRAHRVVYEAVKGPIPDGLVLDHLCRNRKCVNPDHLEPVTLAENILRGESPTAQNARKTHCIEGHEFTPENTIWRGHMRSCRECARRRGRDWIRRKRAQSSRRVTPLTGEAGER